MISFNQIPIDLRTPGVYIEVDPSAAFRGLSGIPTRLLVIGQKLASGSAAPLELERILSADQAGERYGRGSMLAHMLAALKEANSYTECWAIAVEDAAAGAAATGAIEIAGAVTAAGTLNVYIGGRRIRIGVAATDTPAALATALVAAIAADPDLPVTAAVNGVEPSTVDLTARNKGEAGNDIDVRINYYVDERTPGGLAITVTAMAGGAGNPDIASVLDLIGDEWFTDIISPWTDAANLVALEGDLAQRFGPLKMIDGHAYAGAAGTHAELATLGESRNSPHVSIIGAKASPTPPWEWAAAIAGVCAYHGKIDPARPFQTLTVPGLLPPAAADRFTLEERNLLLFDGISTFRVDAGGLVVIERMITTYRENSFGVADPAYLDLTTLKTLTYLRYDLRTFIGLRYPRHKLANDGTAFARGQAVVTPKTLKADIVARFRQWEEAGLAEGIDQFKADLIVERDPNDPNRVNALVPPDIVNQLRVFAGLLQFRL